MCIRQLLASVVLLTYTGHARRKAKSSKRVSSANPHNAVKYVTNNNLRLREWMYLTQNLRDRNNGARTLNEVCLTTELEP